MNLKHDNFKFVKVENKAVGGTKACGWAEEGSDSIVTAAKEVSRYAIISKTQHLLSTFISCIRRFQI